MRQLRLLLPLLALLLLGMNQAAAGLVEVCPGVTIQDRGADYEPGGIILTAFDKSGIWVYNVDRNSRYPLPDTRPCNRHCRLSPDAQHITYIDPVSGAMSIMRVDGTQRSPVSDYAHDIEWWPDNRLFIWTPGHQAYWRSMDASAQAEVDVHSIVSVQPGGEWGLYVEQEDDHFTRSLINLQTRNLQGIANASISLGEAVAYFDATAWSPDGSQFAYVAPGVYDSSNEIAGAELFVIKPDEASNTQISDLNASYGAVRINGGIRSELSWSPDSTRIAYWVIELLGAAYESQTGNASIHITDTRTGVTQAYCGYSTSEHTPDPPRLLWSPDGTHLAFGGNLPGDDSGYRLLALDTDSGVFTILSNGIYPVMGKADVIAWGLP